jgi:DNA-directed RNA polymerase III subunit RPC3
MLLKLVTGRYLKASILLSHQSPRDKLLKYDAEERKKISGFPTSRQLVEAKESAVARLRREEREAEKVGIVSKFMHLRSTNNWIRRCRSTKWLRTPNPNQLR